MIFGSQGCILSFWQSVVHSSFVGAHSPFETTSSRARAPLSLLGKRDYYRFFDCSDEKGHSFTFLNKEREQHVTIHCTYAMIYL